MASEVRVNQIQNRSGLGTVTFGDSGVTVAGITTLGQTNTTGFSNAGVSTLGNATATTLVVSGVSTLSGGVNASQGVDATGLRVTGITTLGQVNITGLSNAGVSTLGNATASTLVVSGVSTVAAGSVSAPSITPTGDSNTGIFFPSADTIAFGEGGSEAARIDSSGRLLLGTSSTALTAALQVNGTIAYADANNTNYTQPTIGIANGGTTTFNVVLPDNGSSAFQITLSASANGGDIIGGVTAILYGFNDGATRRRNLQTLNSSNWSFSATSISGATVTITVTNSSGYQGHTGGVRLIRLV